MLNHSCYYNKSALVYYDKTTFNTNIAWKIIMENKHFLFVILSLITTSCLAIDTIKIKKKDALFTANQNTVPIVKTNYVGWNKGWKWASSRVNIESSSKYHKFVVKNNALDLSISGKRVTSQSTSTWHYQSLISKSHPNAIGFGINFSLNLNAPSLNGKAKEPQLLPNNSGWRWQTGLNELIEVKFTPSLSHIYFERGQKNRIRAMFFNTIKKGHYKFKMSVSVQTKGKVVFKKSKADRTFVSVKPN